ncbi:MAG: hypothetical protein ACJ78Q_01585 [Chloroflexia bacterium]
MHLALLPGPASTLAGGVLSAGGAQTVHNVQGPDLFARAHSLFSIAAQTVTTATGTISSTATVTQTTPVPLPTVGSQAGLRVNPLNWTYLTTPHSPLIGPFGWIYLAVMIGLFGLSAYIYFFKRLEWKRTNPVLKRAADRWGPIGLWVSGLGMVFVAFRAVSLDFLNLPFWFYLWLLAAIVFIAWIYYWYRTTYPIQLAKYQKTQRARQYMPSSSKKGPMRPLASPPSTPVASTSGGKKRKRK